MPLPLAHSLLFSEKIPQGWLECFDMMKQDGRFDMKVADVINLARTVEPPIGRLDTVCLQKLLADANSIVQEEFKRAEEHLKLELAGLNSVTSQLTTKLQTLVRHSCKRSKRVGAMRTNAGVDEEAELNDAVQIADELGLQLKLVGNKLGDTTEDDEEGARWNVAEGCTECANIQPQVCQLHMSGSEGEDQLDEITTANKMDSLYLLKSAVNKLKHELSKAAEKSSKWLSEEVERMLTRFHELGVVV